MLTVPLSNRQWRTKSKKKENKDKSEQKAFVYDYGKRQQPIFTEIYNQQQHKQQGTKQLNSYRIERFQPQNDVFQKITDSYEHKFHGKEQNRINDISKQHEQRNKKCYSHLQDKKIEQNRQNYYNNLKNSSYFPQYKRNKEYGKSKQLTRSKEYYRPKIYARAKQYGHSKNYIDSKNNFSNKEHFIPKQNISTKEYGLSKRYIGNQSLRENRIKKTIHKDYQHFTRTQNIKTPQNINNSKSMDKIKHESNPNYAQFNVLSNEFKRNLSCTYIHHRSKRFSYDLN